MDCKQFREVLDLYLDHELSVEATAAAHVHVRECFRCRKAEQELLKLRAALKSAVSQHQPSVKLVAAVQQITQSRRRNLFASARRGFSNYSRKNIRVPVPVFTILLIALVGLTIFSVRRETPTTTMDRTEITSRTIPAGPTSEQATDFSRFDHGERATLYKTTRD